MFLDLEVHLTVKCKQTLVQKVLMKLYLEVTPNEVLVEFCIVGI